MPDSHPFAALVLVVSTFASAVHAEPPLLPDWPVGGSIYAPPANEHQAPAPQGAKEAALHPSPEPGSTGGTVVLTSLETQTPAPQGEAMTAATQAQSIPSLTAIPQAPTTEPERASAPPSGRLLTTSNRDAAGDKAATNPLGAVSSLGLSTGTVYATLSALAIVIGLFLACVWVFRRAGRSTATLLPTEVASMIGRVRLTPRQSADLIKVGNKLVLVATTPTGLVPLTEVSEPAEVNHLLGLCRQFDRHSTTQEFEEVFRDLARDPAPEALFGPQAGAGATPVAEAYRAHRREAPRV